MQQITIRFDAGLVESYPTLKELVAARVHQQGKPQKAIAADLDLSPSDLSRKLACATNDNDTHRNFDINLLVRFIEQTGDKTPIDWLVEKFYHADELESLRAKVAELESRQGADR